MIVNTTGEVIIKDVTHETSNPKLGSVYINCCNCYDLTELNEVYEEE